MKFGIIVGTNREDSYSGKIAVYYRSKLLNKGQDAEILSLKDLPPNFAYTALNGLQSKDFEAFQQKIDHFDKLVLIIPEYNGSFPGILKSFFDALRYPDSLSGKKVALVGVSSGAYGNAVGLSHISDILAYMHADVLGLRIKLANIMKHFSNDAFSFEVYTNFVSKQIDAFIKF